MTSRIRLLILAAVVVGVAIILAGKASPDAAAPGPTQPSAAAPTTASTALPRVLCLGAGACVPCRQMEPVREALRTEYAGKLIVEFHDVWKDPAIARQHHIRGIPTTILYDAEGRELGRVEGYIGKDDLLDAFDRLGVHLRG